MDAKQLKKILHNKRIWVGMSILGCIIFAALFAHYLAPFEPNEMDLRERICSPSAKHPLGCDLSGGDVLTSLLYGARVSLYIAFLTVLFSASIGVLIGLISGYYGGIIDHLFMRLVDITMAIPGILVAMVLAALLGPSVHNIIIAISATGWTSSARLIRGQVLSLKERDYIMASVALGAPSWRVLFKHIFPGTLSPLVVHTTFSLSGVIVIEASLSFLGLGAQQGPPTWGALLNQGKSVLTEAPHLSISPGIAIMLLILALNFLGDALRDILDPKQSR